MALTPEEKHARARRRAAERDRDRAVVALKVEGYTYHEIVDRLQLSSVSVAHRAYERYLAATADLAQVEQRRELELRRLERLHMAWWPLAIGETAPPEPQEARQPVKPDIEALGAVLRIHDRVSRLLGLDREPTVDPEEILRQAARDAGLEEDDVLRQAEGIILSHGLAQQTKKRRR